MDVLNSGAAGFTYEMQCFAADGSLKWEFTEHNLIPSEGIAYLVNAATSNGAQYASWYIGLYSNARAPVSTDTGANIASLAGEITSAYSEATRVALTGAIVGGVWSNVLSPAMFSFTAGSTTVTGGFVVSASAKSGTSGVLLSEVYAPSPKVILSGETLKVIAGLSISSL